MDSLLLASAQQLARQIRQREVTSEQVVGAHIAHLRRVNPRINAVVHDRYEAALSEARLADERVASGDPLPPLHGVPCTIKECFSFAGMPNSAGLVARRHIVGDVDAPAVARLRAAGAIPLGVTNLSELCMWMESNNRVYGRCSNPYDPTRTAGGSSGGEGAAIGAGGSPFGLGSDVGGSIRMPAFFNGVFGHKPSPGLVPSTGQHPAPYGRIWRYAVAGPICRRAEDIYPLLGVLTGAVDEDPSFSKPATLRDPATVDLRELRVLDVAPLRFPGVDRRLLEAQSRAADALGRAGARVQKAQFPELDEAVEIWSAMMAIEAGPPFVEQLGEGRAVALLPEFGRLLVGRSDHTLPALGLGVLERLVKSSPARMRQAADAGERLRVKLDALLADGGVMLFPSFTQPAPRHGRALVLPIQWIYTGILNMLEFAATQVPLGLDERGLPLGVQVASSWGNDHLTIAAALELERAFGGWVPPPVVPAEPPSSDRPARAGRREASAPGSPRI